MNLESIKPILEHSKRIFILVRVQDLSSPSQELFFELLRHIRSFAPDTSINLIQKKFKDTEITTEVQNEMTINALNYFLADASSYARHENGLYIPRIFEEEHTLVIFSEASIHTHHNQVYPFTCLEELGLLCSLSDYDWSKKKRQEAQTILSSELGQLGQKFVTQHSGTIIGVLDATNTICTNEHIPFLKTKKHLQAYIDTSLEKVNSRFMKDAGYFSDTPE